MAHQPLGLRTGGHDALSSGQWPVVSGQWAAASIPTSSEVGPETTPRGPGDGPGDRWRDPAPLGGDRPRPGPRPDRAGRRALGPRRRPIGRSIRGACASIPIGTDSEPAAIPVALPCPSGRSIPVLDELASGAGPVLGRRAEWSGIPVVTGDDGVEDAPRELASWTPRLAVVLLAAGWCGHGIRPSTTRNRPVGRPHRQKGGVNAMEQETGVSRSAPVPNRVPRAG